MFDAEVTLSVTEFKAKCLDLFKQLERGAIKRITVTRRGSRIASVSANVPAESIGSLPEFFADMRGLVTVLPGTDLTEPLDIPEPDDPFIGKNTPGDAAA